jgi:hypothetical protein
MGYTKFLAVETNTGGDYPTFPLDATGQILQIFIGTLYFAINYLAFSTAAPFMAKTLPILWLSLVAAFLIQQRRWSSLALMVMISLGITGLLTVTVLQTPQSWQSLLNPGVDSYTAASLHRILFTYLGYLPNISHHLKSDILSKFKLITLAIFAV